MTPPAHVGDPRSIPAGPPGTPVEPGRFAEALGARVARPVGSSGDAAAAGAEGTGTADHAVAADGAEPVASGDADAPNDRAVHGRAAALDSDGESAVVASVAGRAPDAVDLWQAADPIAVAAGRSPSWATASSRPVTPLADGTPTAVPPTVATPAMTGRQVVARTAATAMPLATSGGAAHTAAVPGTLLSASGVPADAVAASGAGLSASGVPADAVAASGAGLSASGVPADAVAASGAGLSASGVPADAVAASGAGLSASGVPADAVAASGGDLSASGVPAEVAAPAPDPATTTVGQEGTTVAVAVDDVARGRSPAADEPAPPTTPSEHHRGATTGWPPPVADGALPATASDDHPTAAPPVMAAVAPSTTDDDRAAARMAATTPDTAPPSTTDGTVAVATPAGAAQAGAPAPSAAPAAAPAAPAISRVLELVERLRAEPPPRSLVVDLGSFGIGRLVVSLRGDAVVVGPVHADASVDPQWMRQLGDALDARGWSLNHHDEPPARGRRRQPPADPWRRPKPDGRAQARDGLHL